MDILPKMTALVYEQKRQKCHTPLRKTLLHYATRRSDLCAAKQRHQQ